MEQKLFDAAARLPQTNATLDTSQIKTKSKVTNGVGRIVITLAACAAAICIILFGALFLASGVKEYNDAVAYFGMHNLSTDGLSRKEIKDVYKDISTGTFTHPKTAGLLAGLDITKLGSADSTLSANRKLQEMYGQYFDMERAHKPLSLDIQRVKLGMHITEVIELLGKPHNFGQTTDAISLEWQTTNGWRYVICVTEEAGTEGMNIFQRYTQHSTVSANPTVLDPIPVLSDRYREMYGNYFDLEREHKPSEADILTVTQKMPIKEVFDLLGKPHGMYQITNTILLWESAQGQTYSIQFYRTDDSPKDIPAIERDLKYGVVIVQPAAWPPEWMVFYYDPTEPTEPTEPLESTDPTDPTDPTNPTDPEAEMLAQYFDLEKAHRPAFDEVLSIQEGTPVQDVVALLGKPHGFAPSHNWATFWWETAEGHAVLVDVRSTKYFPNDGFPSAVENYFKYCVVDWVVPLVELDTPLDNIGEAYDEAALYNAVNRYFYQREAYLLGQASTIDNVVPGLTKDEDAHKAAIAAAGIEWLSSDVVIHSIAYWDSHAQVVATETVTYREDGVEKTAAILHRLQLSGENDEGKISTGGDMYFEAITGFRSCSYLPPCYETPQPNLIKPEVETPKSDVEIMQELFEETNGNWYNYMLQSEYRTVNELKASYVLDTDYSVQPHTPTGEEKTYLEEKFGVNLTQKRVYGHTLDAINSILQQYVGVTLDQVDASGLVYWEQTGMYYGISYSAYGVSANVKRVEHKPDGLIWVYYDKWTNTEWEAMIVTLKPCDTGYQICSNFPERMMIADPDALKMQELFDHTFGDQYYSGALGSEFATPADVDLFYLFIDGFADESSITQREKELLIEKVPNPNVVGGYLRLPAEKIDAKLMELFGITLQQTNQVGMDDWIYLEETNCYYKRNSGTRRATIQVERVEYKADGTVLVYYDRMFRSDKMVVALKPKGSTYQILSNLPEVEHMEPEKAAAWRIAEEKLALYERWMNFGIVCDYESTDYVDMSRFLTEEQKEDYWDYQYRLLCCHTIEEAKAHVKQLVSDELIKGTLDDNLFTDDQGNVYTIVNPTEYPHFEYCTLLEYSDTRIVASVEVWVYELTSVKTFILEKIDGNFIITSVETERR